MEAKIKMAAERVPSIDLNSSQAIARIKEFFSYQPFAVQVDSCNSFFYYAFLGIREEEYTPTNVDEKVMEGVSSISIEAIYLGSLDYECLFSLSRTTGEKVSVGERSSEVLRRIGKAQQLCELKKEVEAGQRTCGLRISGKTRVDLDEKKLLFDDDTIL